MPSSALSAQVLAKTRDTMRRDVARAIEVYREIEGEEVLVMTLQGRVAPADRAVVGRDLQVLQGRTAPSYKVLAIPLGTDIQHDDMVFADGQRYRVVSVETFVHELQCMLAMKQ